MAKGDKGRYSYLDAGQRIIAENKLKTGMKTAETTEKERARNINHQTDKDLTWKYLHGGLTQDDIDRNYNRLTPGRAATLTKGLIMGDVPQKSNPKAYGDMMDFIADKKNSERDCTDKLLEMETAGKLSKDEAQTLAESFIVDPGKDPVMQLSQRPNLPEMLKAQDLFSGFPGLPLDFGYFLPLLHYLSLHILKFAENTVFNLHLFSHLRFQYRRL